MTNPNPPRERDLAGTPVVLTVRSLVAAVGTLVVLVAGTVAGYVRLDAKADAGVEARAALLVVRRDICQLKNFMIYGQQPSPYDGCSIDASDGSARPAPRH